MKIYSLAAGLLLVAGCNLTRAVPMQQPAPVVQQAEEKKDVLVATVSSDKETYKKGEVAHFTITLKNTGDKDLNLTFSSGQSFDLQAYKPGSTDASWTWSMDKMFTMALRNQTLKAGETWTFKGGWLDVPAGEYNVIGRVTLNPAINTAPVKIVVK